jgi:hypothetical protein
VPVKAASGYLLVDLKCKGVVDLPYPLGLQVGEPHQYH